eukprot:NODE_8381_length_1499_cov_9.561953.p1 GENE.NODE_8381_length_1499_cov_9.561953~~NODE_8381_length_1499_cov_9.561953.p1  ORF type:complete len:364 (-),score=113.86 NODE_8381_length_1499_cov_9.561953:360-1451(-)
MASAVPPAVAEVPRPGGLGYFSKPLLADVELDSAVAAAGAQVQSLKTPGDGRDAGSTEHRRGIVLAVSGALCFVPDATFVKLESHTPFLTLALWRLGCTGAGLSIFLIIRYGNTLLTVIVKMGRWGVFTIIGNGVSNMVFLFAVLEAPVANVMMLLSTAPLWAALLNYCVLGLKVPPQTIAAIPVVVAGIALVLFDRLSAEGGGHNIAGDAAALSVAMWSATRRTVYRMNPDIDMVPSSALGSALGAIALFPMCTSRVPAAADWLPVLGVGISVPTGSGLVTTAARMISSVEGGLFLCLEVVFSPLLASAVLGTTLDAKVLGGGALVVGTLVLHTIWPELPARWAVRRAARVAAVSDGADGAC